MFENLSDRPIAEVQNKQVDEWKKEDLLDLCVKAREGRTPFVFYDGPPTANGKPGIHHVMARTLKDSINRYKTMKGYQVRRKAGWDTHGLPVEIQVEKELGFTGKNDIEEYGVEEFNKKCRESVFTFTDMWREMSERMGYMADLDDPYITLDNNYIESVWWILSQFYKEDMVYEGHKILPYCPRCGTGLASHEVAQGYKPVKVNTITAKFKLKGTDNEYFLAWTTTAWTLAANMLLSVGPDIDYVRVKMTEGDEKGNIFYLAKALADKVLGEGNYEVLDEMKGRDLEYKKYERLMPWADVDEDKAFFVTCADYVSVDDGTGIVHSAPAFGEDDYNCGMKYGAPVYQPVDGEGKYTETPWKGRFIMEDGLDVDIIKWLAKEDKLFAKQKIEHDYPHCWRCGTPLVYYARQGWYISMSDLRDELVENNKTVNWNPPFVGEGRFGNWLADVRDWNISRTRYWGTPLPLWRCECGAVECCGSRQELADKAVEDVNPETVELHRPYVDDIHLRCPDCGKPMTRVSDVMDCWFDSGSMPFAQWHYPFEHKEDFDKKFPADFISEGIDQTRGWFYSLMAISTFLKKQAPYKNVLVNDLILDKNGKKMSKSKGNTISPFELFDKYGADATRWYLLSGSPAWAPTKFDEEGLKEVVSKFFGTLKNVYNFFVLYANMDNIEIEDLNSPYEERTELDRWILSKYNRLVETATYHLDHYEHMKMVRAVSEFVNDDLSNWYIRRARRRFYQEEMNQDKKAVYSTTYEVLEGIVRMIAPIAPFISDEMYKKLVDPEGTVHIAYYPEPDASKIDEHVEERMDLVKNLATLGRGIREKESLKVRQPLQEILVDGKYEALISDLKPLLMDELNVKNVVFAKDLSQYMNYSLKPNFPVAGPELGGKIRFFGKALAASEPSEFSKEMEEKGCVMMDLGGEMTEIKKDFVEVKISAKENFAVAMEDDIFVIMETEITPELEEEGLARELVSKVQQMRKQNDFEMTDRIKLMVAADEAVIKAVNNYKEYIMSETLAVSVTEENGLDSVDLNGHITGLAVERV